MSMTFRIFILVLFAMSAFMLSASTGGQLERINSMVLGEEREYQVHLPASYSWAQDRRYPVLYVLDGQTHFSHTASSVSFLAQQGEIPEMIVVALTSTVRVRDFTQSDWSSHWIGGGGAENFKRFFSTELIPAIDRNYRTDGFRALSGHSAGGQFVLYCLTAEPALFAGYIALSPSLHWDDKLPQRSLEASFVATSQLKSFLYVARCNDSGEALADYDQLVETLRSKSPAEFRWHSEPFPNETHGSIPLLAQIDALRQLYAGYRLHNDMLEKGLAFAEQHFQTVSKTIGWPLPIPEGVINSLGYEALSQGEIQNAIALFTRNIEANPNSANAYDSLADGFAAAGMWVDAVRASDRALALAVEFDHPDQAYFMEQIRRMQERAK